MIQIKCKICGMVTNIDEEKFLSRFKDTNDGITAEHTIEGIACVCCGNEISYSFQRYIKKLIRKKDFGNWEIGTYFKSDATDLKDK